MEFLSKNYKKLVILLVILVAFTFLFSLVPVDSVFNYVKSNSEALKEWSLDNIWLSALLFIIVYSFVASLPVASIMTLLGGYLFGLWYGLILTVIGATSGAVLTLLVSRYVLGDRIYKKYQKQFSGLQKEIDENGALYLLNIRLNPLFSFSVINILSGFTNIKLKDYIWPTAIGIIPGSFVYTLAGTSLSEIDSLSGILTPNVVIAFSILVLFSLVPIIMKKRGAKKVV